MRSSLRDKLIVALIDTLIFGIVLAGFGYWLNSRLETNKKELADDTEKLKIAIRENQPLIQQRRSAYLDIQRAAHRLNSVLEIYYLRAPTSEVWSNKLRALENDMGIGSGSTGGSWVTKEDVTSVLGDVVSLREKNADISSRTINSAVDSFLETVMEDLRNAQQKQNQTESFDSTARTRLKEALERLDSAIDQSLRIGELPFK